jgi:hypothetical protein
MICYTLIMLQPFEMIDGVMLHLYYVHMAILLLQGRDKAEGGWILDPLITAAAWTIVPRV